MKKGIALLLAAALSISAAGCSNKGEGTEPETEGAGGILAEEIAGEITVSCYDSLHKDFLENAARLFEAKYPGTKINIEASAQIDVKSSDGGGEQKVVIEADGDTQGQMDYITKVNTALMSGGGADIYGMDVLPYYKYAENGQLEDLQKYMDQDEAFQKDDYRMNVIEALQYKGGQYIFPLDYSFYYYDYDQTLLDESAAIGLQSSESFTLAELFETAERSGAVSSTGKKIMGMKGYANPVSSASVFNEEFSNSYTHFIDIENKKANFTDGTFEKLLDQVKTWEEQGYILQSGSGDLSVEDFSASSSEQYYYKLKNNIELLCGILRELDGWEISIPVAGVSPSTYQNDKFAGLLKGEDGSVLFSYSQGYGINSNSQNKRLAWEFIKFMAGEEIQETLQLYPVGLMGLPIHNEARMNKAEDGITGELFGLKDESGSSEKLTEAQSSALDSYISAVEKCSDMLNAYPITDVTIDDIINAEVKSFFEGKVSSAAAAEAIQNKVNRYLNE